MSTDRDSRAERGEIAFVGHGGRRPRVLAHGGRSSRCLASDARYLYWIAENDGEVTRLPKDGGVPMVLGTAPRARGLLHADGFLYWAQPGSRGRRADGLAGTVMRMASDGGPIEGVLTDLPSPRCLAVSGRDVAVGCDGDWGERWLDEDHWESRGLVLRATLGGARATVAASRQRGPCSLLFVDDALYWTNHGYKRSQYFADGSVMRMPRAGGKKRCVVRRDQALADALVADERYVYWTTAATVYAPVPYRRGAIWRRPRAGGRSEAMVVWDQESGSLAVDATHVYWLGGDRGELYRVRKDGGEPELIMSCAESWMVAEGLVVDEHRAFWVVSDAGAAGGAVWCIAKDPPAANRGKPTGDAAAGTLN
jgi:hypothetical protein